MMQATSAKAPTAAEISWALSCLSPRTVKDLLSSYILNVRIYGSVMFDLSCIRKWIPERTLYLKVMTDIPAGQIVRSKDAVWMPEQRLILLSSSWHQGLLHYALGGRTCHDTAGSLLF